MSQEESRNARRSRAWRPRFLGGNDGVNHMKWVDASLCRMLFLGEHPRRHTNLTYALRHYNQEERYFRYVLVRGLPLHTRGDIYCLITTPCRCARPPPFRMTRYKCDLPLLRSGPSIHVCVDVSSDIPYFPRQWNRYLRAAGAITVDVREFNEVGEVYQTMQLSDYDCVILYLTCLDFERQECGHLNELGRTLDSRQTFALTCRRWQILHPYPNVDCMERTFRLLGGFRFPLFLRMPLDWRIWCNRRQNNSMIDFVEIVRWACLRTMCKRRRLARA